MKHRLFISTMALALVNGGAAPALSLESETASRKPAPSQGFCRTADPLPALGAEIEQNQQRPIATPHRGKAVGAAPPSGDAFEPEDGSVVVTGTRIDSPAFESPSPVTVITEESIESDGGEAAADAADGGYALPPVAVTPPPPPPPAKAVAGGDERVSTMPMPEPTPYPYPDRRPGPRPQAGLLTAGEHDDLLNPELYARYARRSNLAQTIPDLPKLDTMRVLTVKVTDSNGQAVPFANVTLTCSDGNRIAMATQADGTATFFPGLDRLSREVSIGVVRGGAQAAAPRDVIIANGAGGQQVNIVTRAAAVRPAKLDLMLVVDTTGSMGDEIRYLQSELQSILSAIEARHRNLDIRVGFVFYRDEGDDYVTRTVGFDRDFGKAQAVLARQIATGGGDYPEAMDQAMIRAIGQDWRPDAVKSLLLVADAPPHNDKFGRTWLAAEAARAKRVHITPIAASGVADEAEYGMRAMAALTQSRYLFLTDDSGVGNPHAPPAIDCYLVTRLNDLVRRVVDSQISGRRIEPDDGEVIRTVGKYDAGKCILPADFDPQQ